MEALLTYAHWLLDSALGFTKLVQKREVRWLTVVRRTGEYKREQQPLMNKIKLLLLFNPLTEWIDRTHLFRLFTHERNLYAEEVSPQSQQQIQGFVDFFHINMKHCTPSDPKQYTTFQNFCIRRHAPGARPLHASNDNSNAVIVADSRVVVYPTVERTRKLWVKGNQFTIANLIHDEEHARPWDNGAVACFRLSPQDCHRYHSPVSGEIKWFKQIPRDYFEVDPLALQSSVNVLTENARCAVCIETEEFGDVLFVAVGAGEVGTVERVLFPACYLMWLYSHQSRFREKTMTTGQHVSKGEELGLFKFGGSMLTVAFE